MKSSVSVLARNVSCLSLVVTCLSLTAFAQAVHPTLSFTSYLLNPADRINALAAGKDGSAYVAGVTVARPAAFDVSGTSAGEGNAFVAKFSPDGSRLVYFTYLGKSGLDESRAIAIDGDGNAYVAGKTRARNFPILRALQSACQSDGAGECAGTAFVAKVDAKGKLVFATYLGGSGGDEANAIAVDGHHNIFVAGSTHSLDFPVTAAVQQSAAGDGDAFVAGLAADGSRLLFATYLGGSGSDEGRALALDAVGNVYLTGRTTSLDFPVQNALQPHCSTNRSGTCGGSVFVAKISQDGMKLRYSTYLGGSGGDTGNAIMVDERGSAYVAGITASPDFPLMRAGQAALRGRSNAFVSKISAPGSSLIFSTYLGGSGADQASAIAMDRSKNIVVAGWTFSQDFPVRDALEPACNADAKYGCSYDAFVAELTSSGSELHFSTYLGGTGADISRGLAVDGQGSVYLAGWTSSRDFPQARQPMVPVNLPRTASIKNPSGAFVAKISGLNNDPGPSVSCSGGTKNWVGTVGDNLWTSANNWSPAGVPVSTDNVCVPTGSATIGIGALVAANQTIASLTAGAPLSITNGPLTITGTSSFADLTIAGGTLTLSATSTMATLHETGGVLSGAGDISISGLLTWQSGAMCTNFSGSACSAPVTQAVTNANGGISLTGTTSLAGRTLNNAGTASYTSAFSFGMLLAATVNNKAGATWDVSNNGNIGITGSGNTFNNAGTLKKTAGTGNSLIDAIFNNTGSVQAGSGNLIFRGGGNCGSSCAGTWNVTSGGNLQFNVGTYVVTGAIANSGGTLLVNGATLDFTGATETITGPLTLSAGVVFGPATLNLTGLLTWQGGSMCTNFSGSSCSAPVSQAVTNANGGISFTGSPFLQGRTLNNPGTAAYTNAFSPTLTLGAVVNNLASGTWDLSNNGNVGISGSGNTFNNAGTLIKTAGTGNSFMDAVFNNTGSVSESSGNMIFRGGGDCGSSCAGSWTVNTGGSLQFNVGTYVLTGAMTNSGGTLLFNGATLNFVKSGTTTITGALNQTAGVVFGPSTLTITGLLTWQGGSMCTNFSGSTCSAPATQAVTNANGGISFTGSPFLQGRTLNNAATAAYTNAFSPTLTLGAIVNNKVGATWDLSNNGNIGASGTGNTFNNAGSLGKTSGTANSLVDAIFNNTGNVTAGAGNMIFRGGGACGSSCNGTWTVNSGGNLQFNVGTYVLTGDMTNHGTLLFNGGNLDFVKAGTTTITGPLNQTAGVVFGSATLTITGLLTWQGGSMCTNFSGSTCSAPTAQAITNANGGISFTGSPFLQGRTLNSPGMASYTAAFTLQMLLSAIVNNPATGTWDLSNNGNISNSGSGNAFNNAGNFKKAAGTGNSLVDIVFNNTGSVHADSGAMIFRGMFTQTAGSTELSGGATLQFTTAPSLQGGIFSGFGTVTGNLNNSGANLAPGPPGTPPAIINESGAYTQSSPGAYTASIRSLSGNCVTDVLNVSGAATLGGPLNMVLAGCTPALNQQFTVMTFASKTGTFSSVSSGWAVSYTASSAIATFQGGGGTPTITITPAKLTFAAQAVDIPSKAKTITIGNSGTAPLHISNIAITGDFSQTNTCTTLNPGATCKITVKFKPTDKNTRTGSLTLTDDSSTGSTQNVPLTGVGTFLMVTPNPIAFPAQLLNTTSGPMTITFKNVNPSATLNISSVTLAGTVPGDYSQNSACTAIPANGTCTFTMRFTPSALGKRAAQLKVVEDGGGSPLKITISGSGTYVTLAPSPVAFGTVTVGNTSSLPVTLTNHNPSAAVSVASVTTAGTNKADFTASAAAGCSSVPANGGTCTITVNFKPKAAGSRSGSLTVKNNDAGSPQTDTLTGTGQ